jgi:hypothetical protein
VHERNCGAIIGARLANANAKGGWTQTKFPRELNVALHGEPPEPCHDKRRALTSIENLRLVAADIARFATQAAMGDGFKSLLAGGTARDHATLQTFEEESRWHLQRLRERGS